MTVWISDVIASAMVAAARAMHPLETGGVLLGWRDDGDRIVAGLTGPGPGALHGQHMLIPDHKWQLLQIKAAFAKSDGDLDYLGDWHSHPSGAAQMSGLDNKTLARLGRRVNGALMLIAAGADDAWSFGAWSQRHGGLFRRYATDTREVRVFTPASNWPHFSAL